MSGKPKARQYGKPCNLICCGPKSPRFDTDGAHCPRCDEPMEMDLGPIGNPAWFHVKTPKGIPPKSLHEKCGM